MRSLPRSLRKGHLTMQPPHHLQCAPSALAPGPGLNSYVRSAECVSECLLLVYLRASVSLSLSVLALRPRCPFVDLSTKRTKSGGGGVNCVMAGLPAPSLPLPSALLTATGSAFQRCRRTLCTPIVLRLHRRSRRFFLTTNRPVLGICGSQAHELYRLNIRVD